MESRDKKISSSFFVVSPKASLYEHKCAVALQSDCNRNPRLSSKPIAAKE
eukprot:m.61259 g.61259  ORF g.61259 m.61259 type:complete len:50 (-) comp13868_c3_seq7:1869-2018(-)